MAIVSCHEPKARDAARIVGFGLEFWVVTLECGVLNLSFEICVLEFEFAVWTFEFEVLSWLV